MTGITRGMYYNNVAGLQGMNPTIFGPRDSGHERNWIVYSSFVDQRVRRYYPDNTFAKHISGHEVTKHYHHDAPVSVQILEALWETITGYGYDDSQHGVFLHSDDSGTRVMSSVSAGSFAVRHGNTNYLNLLFGEESTPGTSAALSGDCLATRMIMWEDNVNILLQDNGSFRSLNVPYKYFAGDYLTEQLASVSAYEAAWHEYSRRFRIWADHHDVNIIINLGSARTKQADEPAYYFTDVDLVYGQHDILAHYDGITYENLLIDTKRSNAFTVWHDVATSWYGILRRELRLHKWMNDNDKFIYNGEANFNYALRITNNTAGSINYSVVGNVVTVNGNTFNIFTYTTVPELIAAINDLENIACDKTDCNPWQTGMSSFLLEQVSSTAIAAGASAYINLIQQPRLSFLTRICALFLIGIDDYSKIRLVGPTGLTNKQQDSDVYDAPAYLGASQGTEMEVEVGVFDSWARIPNQVGDQYYHEYANAYVCLNWTNAAITVEASDFDEAALYSLNSNFILPGVAWSSNTSFSIPAYSGDILFKSDINP